MDRTIEERSNVRKAVMPLIEKMLDFYKSSFDGLKKTIIDNKVVIPEVQKVKVINQKEINIEQKEVNFPEVQKVQVLNPTTIETKEVNFPEVQKVQGTVTDEQVVSRLNELIQIVEKRKQPKPPETQNVKITNWQFSETNGGGAIIGSNVLGRKITVGTSAVQIKFSDNMVLTKTITIQSDHDNTGSVWVGGSLADSSGNSAIGKIVGGDVISIDINNYQNNLYVVSDTASQTIYLGALI